MSTVANATNATTPRKTHYAVLDGLRGVASLMVMMFHTFEANDGDNRFRQIINHGYLAVDFFFLLSGFVIAYAYDDRWTRMTVGGFFTRRLIRLQPMVVLGNAIGAALFYRAAGTYFPLIAHTPVPKMLLVMLLGFTLLPLPVSMDIRGWQEMHPLDGPCWSLFFEYIANILYALGLRRLGNRALGVLVVLAGIFLAQYAVFGGRGDVIGGWAIDMQQMHIGFARLLFPFMAGILLQRLGAAVRMGSAFAVSSLLLIVVLALPRFGGPDHLWINGLYESLCILLVFPLIVAIGAGEHRVDGPSIRIARFFGDLSYPLYLTHYPLIYVYTAWVVQQRPTHARSAAVGVAVDLGALVIAYACLKLFDEPVRRWLSRRFLPQRA